MKRQLTGFVDVYAAIKHGDMSLVSFVDWLDAHYDKKKRCKSLQRLRK